MFSNFSVYRLKGIYQDCHGVQQPREILGDEEIASGKCHNPTISWPWVSKHLSFLSSTLLAKLPVVVWPLIFQLFSSTTKIL